MLEQVKTVVAGALDIDEGTITLEASLNDDLGIDSLEAVELIMELEDAFDIKIDDAEARVLVTVADILNLLEAKKKWVFN